MSPAPDGFREEIDQMLTYAYELRGVDPDNSLTITQEVLQRSREGGYEEAVARAYNQLALIHTVRCEFDVAFDYSSRALAYFESVQDKRGIALSRYNIGGIYYRSDNFHRGLLFLSESLQLFRELHDLHNEARVLKSIGTIYEFFKDYDNAIDVYQKSIVCSKSIGDKNLESNCYNPLSGIYLKRGNLAEARRIIEESIALKRQTGDMRGLAFALYGRGKIFLKEQRFEDAERDFLQCLSIQMGARDQLGLGMVYNKLGILYHQWKRWPEARYHLQAALQVANEFNVNLNRYKAHYNLYRLYKDEGNTDEALAHLENYLHYKDKVINAETYHIIETYEEKTRIDALEHEARTQRVKAEIIQHKNNELDSFFYRVSHDLKGPIASLQGLNNLIMTDVKDEKALSYLSMYEAQISRIDNIVTGLIHLTRLNHGEEFRTRINFTRLVDECIQSYSYLENFKRIRFIREIQSDIHFDSEWPIVNTILQNLIENAIVYARTNVDSFIRIAVTCEQGVITLTVEDNGQGISQDHLTRIFDMFHRANGASKGSGLGLYILKRAVERLQGDLRVSSQLHLGTTFTVNLPV